MSPEQRQCERYAELFVHRRDVFARQTPRGSYFLTRSSITPDIIHAHLRGAMTAGFYAPGLDDSTRWIVLDADRPDGLAQLQDAWSTLDGRGIPSHLELSRRGGHLWILFEPIATRVARRLILGTLPELDGIEVFPKCDWLEDGRVGNCVRGPFGVHRLTGKRYPFVDPISLQPVSASVGSTIDYLATTPRLTPTEVAEHLAAGLDERPERASAVISPEPPASRHSQGGSEIATLKRRIGDLHDFASQFVELNKAGRGHCPFHPPDRNPSLSVDRERGFWVCFHEVNPRTGRYLGGDAIELYWRLKGISRRQALVELRALYGLN
jgi:hypothetical protein